MSDLGERWKEEDSDMDGAASYNCDLYLVTLTRAANRDQRDYARKLLNGINELAGCSALRSGDGKKAEIGCLKCGLNKG